MLEHDKIVKIIGDKLRDYEAGEASDADWEAFRAAMPVQEKKKRTGFWLFAPFLVIGSALFAYVLFFNQEPSGSNNAAVSVPNEVVLALSPKTNQSVSAKKLESKKSKPEQLNIPENTTVAAGPVLSNSKTSTTSLTKKELSVSVPGVSIKQSENPLQKQPIDIEQALVIDKKENSKKSLEIGNSDEGIIKAKTLNEENKNVLSKNKEEINSLNVEQDILKDNTGNKTEQLNDTNQIIVADKKNEEQPVRPVKTNHLQLKHFDLFTMYTPGMAYFEKNLSSNPMPGIGIALAYRVQKQWYISSGLQYMFARTQSKMQNEVSIEYATISKIDTSLKFDIASSTIMMDIDTHYQNHSGMRKDEYLIVRKSQVISIPVLFGYSLGNHRTELSLFGGVQNDWLMEEFTSSHLLNKTTETKTKQIYLPAPVMGFAFGARFSGNWSMNLGMDYRYYLSDDLTKKDFWRIQAGFRYHIK